jgi:anti-sigma factor RsiW
MKHKKLQLLVSSYVDNEIDDKDRSIVLTHVKECPECARFAERAKRIHDDIRAVADIDPQNSFTKQIMRLIDAREERTEEWMGIEPLARNTFIALAAFVLIVLSVSFFSNRSDVITSDQFITTMSGDSASMNVLFQQKDLSKDDVLYAAVNK